MPIISAFFGMLIKLYHNDHNPPHLHVQYGEYEAVVAIGTGEILQGRLPPRVHKLLREWLRARREEVTKAWRDAREMRQPRRVKPLE